MRAKGRKPVSSFPPSPRHGGQARFKFQVSRGGVWPLVWLETMEANSGGTPLSMAGQQGLSCGIPVVSGLTKLEIGGSGNVRAELMNSVPLRLVPQTGHSRGQLF